MTPWGAESLEPHRQICRHAATNNVAVLVRAATPVVPNVDDDDYLPLAVIIDEK